MEIAFDFHGVLEKYPSKFRPFLASLRIINTITILSGPTYKQIEKELTSKGYQLHKHYDEIISVVDWLKSKNVKMNQHENGNWYCEDEIWWASKAKICEEYGIEMLFDDKLEYKKYIKITKYQSIFPFNANNIDGHLLSLYVKLLYDGGMAILKS